MNFKLCIVLGVSLSIAACGKPDLYEGTTDVGPQVELSGGTMASESSLFALGKDVIRAKLRDPSSAEFSELSVAMLDGKAVGSCGKINSKNGFGGMSGPTRYIAGADVSLIDDGDASDRETFNIVWSKMCV